MKSGRCPYCGSPIEFRSADGIYKDNSSKTMLYVCCRYPKCDAYVRAFPGTLAPVGRMANSRLRALRRKAHYYFDMLHLNGIMTKKEAYEWLAVILQAPRTQAHIGYIGEYYCMMVIEESRRLLDNRLKTHGCPSVRMKQGSGGERYVR
jgi:hypothetical protein